MYQYLVREINLGVKNLLLHGMRSLLTMLGMVFGVGSVVAMLAVGEGASQDALRQILLLGSNNIMIDTVKPADGGSSKTRERTFLSIYGLVNDDARRLETFPAIVHTVPARFLRKEARLGQRNLEVRLVGTVPTWFDLVERDLVAGRTLLARDEERKANVVVLTEHAARKLLAGYGAIGQHLHIGGTVFQVVGIVRSKSSGGGGVKVPDQENDAYIPLNTMRERFGDIEVRRTAGSRERELVELNQILVKVDDIDHVQSTARGIRTMLAAFHDKDDYRLQVPLALLKQAEETKRTFNVVLGSIAAISLLVGGIGIMNIMLASVTERTREIGIRRAIGAKRKQIVGQFLVETVVLSTTGGILGVAVGLLIPWFISRVAGLPTLVTPISLILSLGISMVVGVVFGLYPAVRASRLDPIRALHHE